MTRFLTLFLAVLLPLAPSRAADFAIVGNAMEAVTKHHFANSRPDAPFSMARVSGDRHETYDPIEPAIERAVIASLGPAGKHYIPLSELRFPKGTELDPKDPEGKTYRGIESAKTGESVDVFYISHIKYVDAQTLHVHYASYSGPLAGGGGYYVVRLTKDGFQIKSGEGGWVS